MWIEGCEDPLTAIIRFEDPLTALAKSKGFEDPLTAIVQLEGFEDPLTALKKLRVLEVSHNMKVSVEGVKEALWVRTTPPGVS